MAIRPSEDTTNEALELGRRLAAGGWRVAGIVTEGSSIMLGGFFFGVNPWQHQWESLGASVDLPHPAYPNQIERMHLYRIKTRWSTVVFATGELSAGVWGFYVPAPWPLPGRVFTNRPST